VIVRTTTIPLCDGRELRYYDEHDGADRSAADQRDLPAAAPASELRLDPLTDEWVVIAAHRQHRTHLPAPDACPLCPSTAGRLSEIPAGDYDVVVLDNRFPSMAMAVPDVQPLVGGNALYPRRPGRARCQVVCFSSAHDTSFAQLSPARVRTVVDVWSERSAALFALPGVQQVFAFENRGAEIGVTIPHPHGQIYAYPFVTPRTARMLAAAARHAARTGGNLFADVLRAELDSGERLVVRGAHWTAFVPAAARWPVEVHVFPHRHVRTLPELHDAERDDLATVYLEVLRRLDGLYGLPMPYVAAWYQAPRHREAEHAYLHLQVFSNRRAPDKLKYLAGSEAAMDVFVNDRVPEQTAAALRAAG
jgi:UDPglucose--hexose-1-phosphate uridylyltransferase